MAAAQKDTIYVDIDDEITGIIDKVQSAPNKIVALVLPKRAAVLQSIVNMKLLKHTADGAKKKIVLITSETGLMPLAGAVGLHVAKTLQSKPFVPPGPDTEDQLNQPEEAGEIDDLPLDTTLPVGALAGLSKDEDEEAINVEDSDEPKTDAAEGSKKSPNKKLKVPNFNKFRLRLFLGLLGLILLVVLWYVATVIMPKANIVIRTDTATLSKDFNAIADPGTKAVDEAKSIVPAKVEELRLTDTEKTAATGQKNEGKKASGTMTLTNCIDDGQEHTIPSGTRFTSGSIVFVSTEAVTLDFAIYAGGECMSDDFGRSKDVPVEAFTAGTDHNVSSRTYNSSVSGIEAVGSAMSGGTDKIVKVVSQKDVDTAKAKLIERNTTDARNELLQKLRSQGYIGIIDSISEGKPTVVSSPNVGEEASEVTISSTIIYTMTGAQEEGLKKLLENAVKDEIDLTKQDILETGLDEAQIRVTEKQPKNRLKLSIETIVVAGADLDPEAIKQEIMGKKQGETENIIKNRPGVKEAIVDYSPFWVFSTPKRSNSILITVESVNNNTDADSQP